jgi:Domain of unknown function (DUF397)
MEWKRSSRCRFEPPQCVEVADLVSGVAVRDSKLGDHSPILTVSAGAWRSFISGVPVGGDIPG